MQELKHVCIACLHNKPNLKPCPQCGYDEQGHVQHPLYLKPRTLLKDQYILGIVLGQGGFGITYIGFDKWLQRRVAIKEYLPTPLATRDLESGQVVPLSHQDEHFNNGLQSFINEARHLAKFDHPHIVKVSNYFSENNTGYMVMDYLSGHSLAEVLSHAGGSLATEHALSLLLPILDALHTVHKKSIFHRDISLQNIRLLDTGTPILIDFGAARHVMGECSQSLDLVLNHGYSPLEQYSGRGKIGAWTDIYACAAVLYQLITGSCPPAATDRFSGDTLIAPNCYEHVTISTAMNDAIMHGLHISAEHRFQTIAEFKAALTGQKTIQYQPIIIHSISPSPKRWLTWFNVSVLTGLLSFSAYNSWDYLAAQKSTFFDKEPISKSDKLSLDAIKATYDYYQQGIKNSPDADIEIQPHISLLLTEYGGYINTALIRDDLAEVGGLLKTATQWFQPKDAQVLHDQYTVPYYEKQIQQAITQVQLSVAYNLSQGLQSFDRRAAEKNYDMIHDAYQAEISGSQKINVQKKWLEEALSHFPDSLVFTQRAAQLNQQQQISRLLSQAKQDINALRLSEPKKNNAYYRYQQVLALQPNNQQAQQGLATIAEAYYQLAQQQQNTRKAQHFIDKGLSVVPTYIPLKNLQLHLNKRLVVQNTPAPSVIAVKDTPETKIETSISSKETQKILPIITPPTVEEQKKNKLALLLKQAQQAHQEKNLQQAQQIYHKILTVLATHEPAKRGLQRIAQSYLQQAQQAQQQQKFTDSLTLIHQGLNAVPHHAALLALQKDIQTHLRTQTSTSKAPLDSAPHIFTPSF